MADPDPGDLDARQFLGDVYPTMPNPSVIAVGTAKAPHYVRTVDDALPYVVGQPDRYIRVTLLAGKPRRGRGKDADSIALPGLVADLDVNGSPNGRGGIVEGAFESTDHAITVAHAVLAPTLIVLSGYGVQAWWLLQALELLATDADRERVRAIARSWQERIRLEAQVPKVDGVADLSRLMRVPGSLNAKGETPVPVELHASGGRRYRLAELEVAGAPVADRPRASGAAITADKVDVDAILAANPALARLVRREGKPPGDGSPSVWDWSLACETARSGYAPEAAAALIRHARKLHGENKGEREDYLEATVGKAYAETSQPDDRRSLGLAVGAAWNLGTSDPIIGGRLSGYSGDAFVDLYRASGTVLRLGHLHGLFSPTAHVRTVSSLTRTRFKITPTKAVDVAQTIIQLCDDESHGDEWSGRIAGWTGNLLSRATVLDAQMDTPAGRWAALAAATEERRKNDRVSVVLRDETGAVWIPVAELRSSLAPGAPTFGELDAVMAAEGWRRVRVDMHEPGVPRSKAGHLKATYYVEPDA